MKYTPRRILRHARYRLWLAQEYVSKHDLEYWRYRLPAVRLDEIVPDSVVVEPPILDDICMPPYMGTREFDDFTALMKVAIYLDPSIILEFGTAYGNIAANLCNQIPGCTIYTVNARAEQQTGSETTYSLSAEDIGRVYRRHSFAHRVVQIYENTLSINLADHLEYRRADLGIIDACHDTEYVINDFLKVAEVIRPGGVILLHDTHPSMNEHLHGSYRACLLLRKQGFDVQHISETWWAFWRRPGD